MLLCQSSRALDEATNRADLVALVYSRCRTLPNLPSLRRLPPQIIRPENRCILDRGVWQVKKLRRGQVVELIPWATLFSVDPAPAGPEFVKRDPLALARLYLSLLESGLAKSRADVARYFGVSRARVTQVLRRLETPEPTRREG